ncbi:MAG: fused MFS/spermidine synthase [Candidatus Micrarchaeia archaeon]
MFSEKARLLAAVFISGACSMLLEIAGGRSLYPYLGNTIYTWAGSIGIVLAALSLGYYFGGIMSDRLRERRHLSYILALAGLCTATVPFLALLFGPLASTSGMLLASVSLPLILAPAALLYGMVSPYAIRLVSKSETAGTDAGSIFALSTVGSILGVLATGFVLIPYVGLTHTFALGFALMLVAAALLNPLKKSDSAGVLVLALAFAVLWGSDLSPDIAGQNMLFKQDSQYSLVRVADMEIGGIDSHILVIDNVVSSGEAEGGFPVFPYVQVAARSFDYVLEPKNALVIGCAAGTQAEQLKKRFLLLRVDCVDIDPLVIYAGKRFFSLNDSDGRTGVYVEDGRRFLEGSAKKYDIILVDAFKSLSPPPHLLTREFVLAINRSMSNDSVVAVNIIAKSGGRGAFLQRMYDTYKSVFKNVYVIEVPVDAPLSNYIIISSNIGNPEFAKRYASEFIAMNYTGMPLTDDSNPAEILTGY